MATETLTRLKCDRCGGVEEYEDDAALRQYSYRLSISNGSDIPYMPRAVDICKDCTLGLVHSWWRKDQAAPRPTPAQSSDGSAQ